MERRWFLKGAACCSALAVLPDQLRAAPQLLPFFASRNLAIGAQLFPLAADLRADLRGTLRQLAAIGYRQIETAGLHGYTALEFREAMNRHGLTCPSMQIPAQAVISSGPNLSSGYEAVVSDARTLGATEIVVPLFLLPEDPKARRGKTSSAFIREVGRSLTAKDYRRLAHFLNEKGRQLRKDGLRLSYHNHNFEFAPLGATCGLDMLLRKTDPEIVQFQLDVGWAAAAGVDVPALLRDHPGRFTQMHLKDVRRGSAPNFAMQQEPAELGAGTIDWPRLLPLAHDQGVRGYFVEREAPFASTAMDAMAADYRYLSTLLTV